MRRDIVTFLFALCLCAAGPATAPSNTKDSTTKPTPPTSRNLKAESFQYRVEYKADEATAKLNLPVTTDALYLLGDRVQSSRFNGEGCMFRGFGVKSTQFITDERGISFRMEAENVREKLIAVWVGSARDDLIHGELKITGYGQPRKEEEFKARMSKVWDEFEKKTIYIDGHATNAEQLKAQYDEYVARFIWEKVAGRTVSFTFVGSLISNSPPRLPISR